MATGLPLIGWGLAWAGGYPALGLLDGIPRVLATGALWTLAMLLSWLPLRTTIRTGSEKRMRWAWAAVLASSPFLVAAAEPVSTIHVALLLGGLWSLAMCLYAVATADSVYAGVTLFGTAMAGVAASQDLVQPLVLFGLTAGLPLLFVGAQRVLTSRHV